MQGWESACCGVLGFPLFKDTKVAWFQNFCFAFFVSEIYQISISCFQEDIDLACKMFEILLGGYSSLFGARLFENCQKWISRILRFIKIIENVQMISLIVLKCPGVSRGMIGFGGSGHIPKSRYHRNDEFGALP